MPRDFKIFDADDQIAAVKLALEHLNIKDPGEKVRGLLERISFAKNHAQTPAQIATEAAKHNDPLGITASKVYAEYENILRKAGALDFDDLLLRAVQVLREFPEARSAWQTRFRYIHVDEYQDTNRVQYDLLRLLVNESRNLCVVGRRGSIHLPLARRRHRQHSSLRRGLSRRARRSPGGKLPLDAENSRRRRGRRLQQPPAPRKESQGHPLLGKQFGFF